MAVIFPRVLSTLTGIERLTGSFLGYTFPILSLFFFLPNVFNYIVLITLLQLFWFFLCAPPSLSIPHSLGNCSRHHCWCPWVIHTNSLATPFPMLYLTSPWLFYNYLFVVFNPLTSHPSPHTPLLSSNHPNVLHIHDSISVLLLCLVCFLDSIIDRCAFYAILLFMILMFFFFLSKSL